MSSAVFDSRLRKFDTLKMIPFLVQSRLLGKDLVQFSFVQFIILLIMRVVEIERPE